MDPKGKKGIGRDDLITALYVIGIIIALGFFSTIFFKPVLFVQVITFCFSLTGLALPIVVTYLLYDRNALDTSVRAILWVSLPVILFFGLMLSVSGPTGMPGLLNIMQPMMCPAGLDEVAGDLSVRQFDLPGRRILVSLQSICHGELGTYMPEKSAQIVSGLAMYLLYCGMYFSIVLVVWKQKFFVLQRYAAQGIILALFLPLLFFTLLNASFRAVISKPVNGLLYRGHAVSLVEAIKRHNVGMISDLLARGGDINAKNASNETPLSIAQQYKDKEVLDLFAGQITGGSDSKKALLDKGIVYGEANFFKSVEKNDIENVKLFLSAGMDINALLDSGRNTSLGEGLALGRYTALAVAAINGHKDLMQLLLDKKADINIGSAGYPQKREKTTPRGMTVLHVAVLTSRDNRNNIACHDDIVLLLIKNGADVNAKTTDGETALTMAAQVCPGVAQVLIDNKADIHARTKYGYTALLHAVENATYHSVYNPVTHHNEEVLPRDHYNLVKYLLEHGADPNVNIYSTGDTPLRIARDMATRTVNEWGKDVQEVVRLLEQYHARE